MRDDIMALDAFEEADHPRGQPGNAGQFGPGGAPASGGSSFKPSAEATVTRDHITHAIKTKQIQGDRKKVIEAKFAEVDAAGSSPEKLAAIQPIGTNLGSGPVQKANQYLAQLKKDAGLDVTEKAAATSGTEGSENSASSADPDLKPGNTVEFEANGKSVEIKPGSTVYHTTNANFKKFADRPTWFTPFKEEARGYHGNFTEEHGHARTVKATWVGGKIANHDVIAKAAKEVWPDDAPIYSMFDERVGEYEPKDVRRFIKSLEDAGYDGAIIQDFSSRDHNKDADTLAVFHPEKSIRIEKHKGGEANDVTTDSLALDKDITALDAFKEADHPRRTDGKFGVGGGETSAKKVKDVVAPLPTVPKEKNHLDPWHIKDVENASPDEVKLTDLPGIKTSGKDLSSANRHLHVINTMKYDYSALSSVPLDDIIYQQPSVNKSKLVHLAKIYDPALEDFHPRDGVLSKYEAPAVIRCPDGQLVTSDHHRLIAAKLRGDTHAIVRLFTLKDTGNNKVKYVKTKSNIKPMKTDKANDEMTTRHDVLALDKASVRAVDKDGRLHVSVAHISKATVNEYKGSEIPDAEALGLDPTKVYRLLRDPAELEKAAPTFNNLPILDRHVPVTAEAPRQDLVIGSTGSHATFKAPYLDNSLVFWTQDAINAIEKEERKELSCAYHYKPVLEPGVYEGQAYDLRMTEIIGNHVALVEEGRAGQDVVVGDEKPAHVVGAIDDILHPKGYQMTVKKGATSKALSLKAQVVRGALAAYLAPKLAADAKVDLRSVVLGTTALNYLSAKPVIASRLEAVTKGKLAKDANLKDVHGLLDRLDGEGSTDEDPVPGMVKETEVDPEEITDNPAVDADNPAMAICKFLEGKVAPELLAEARKMAEAAPAEDDAEEDDDMPSDAELDLMDPQEKAKALRAAKDRKAARDRKAKDKAAKDAEMKEREKEENTKAMDSAVTAAVRASEKRMRDLHEAEAFVRPWIGDVAMAQDSAEAVYRLALDSLDVNVKGVHPSAYRAVLNAQPRPGARIAPLAHDAAGAADLAKRLPDFSRLRRA